MAADGLVTLRCRLGTKATPVRLEVEAKAKGMTVFAVLITQRVPQRAREGVTISA